MISQIEEFPQTWPLFDGFQDRFIRYTYYIYMYYNNFGHSFFFSPSLPRSKIMYMLYTFIIVRFFQPLKGYTLLLSMFWIESKHKDKNSLFIFIQKSTSRVFLWPYQLSQPQFTIRLENKNVVSQFSLLSFSLYLPLSPFLFFSNTSIALVLVFLFCLWRLFVKSILACQSNQKKKVYGM